MNKSDEYLSEIEELQEEVFKSGGEGSGNIKSVIDTLIGLRSSKDIHELKDDLNKSSKVQTEVLDKQSNILKDMLNETRSGIESLISLLKKGQQVARANNKEFPKEMKVSNLKDIPVQKEVDVKEPEWLKKLTFSGVVKDIYKTLKQGTLDVNVLNNDPKRPISVRLSDGKLFYKAIYSAVAGGIIPFQTSAGIRKSPLVDNSGHLQVDVLTGGGGGTQYTEGDTDATLTGTIAMAEGPADTAAPLQVDASSNLQVDIAADSVGIGGGTQYTEDVARPGAAVGNTIMSIRDDQISAVTPAEGDWVPSRVTSKGAVWVALADASGDPITSFGGGQEYVTNAVAPDPATGKAGLMERDDALSALTPVEGDWVRQRSTAEGALWTQDFNSDAILADTTTVAGAVAAGQMQVDVVAPLPAGTNVVGKVRLVTATGDEVTEDTDNSVNVTIVADDAGVGGGTQYTEDDAVPANPIGTSMVAERDDALGGLTPAEGDWTHLFTDASGALWTHDNAIDAVISGSEMQVDIVASLPAGTNEIGKLAANSGVDIGDTDVTSIVPGVGASNLGKAEDAAHSSGDVGVASLAVRRDTPTSLAGADNDYLPLTTDEDGAVWSRTHKVGSVIDSGNSSTTPLGIDAVFTGTGVDLLGYTNLTVQLASDVDSSATGVSLEFSSDNSNWDEQHVHFFDSSDESSRKFQLPVHARYFRVVYTNGGTGQAHFRLQTILHTGTPITTIHRLDDTLAPDRSAQVIKASIIAQAAGSGNFTPVQATAGGNLKMSIQEISDGLDIGAGNAGSETARVSISTDDVNLSAIKTAVEGTLTVDSTDLDIRDLANASDSVEIYGSDDGGTTQRVIKTDAGGAVQVDIESSVALDVSAATVTADLGANNDVTIDGSTVVKAEDSASAEGDTGIVTLARRTASPADTSGADLDYEALQMDNGRLWTSTTVDAALPAGDNNIGNMDIVSGTVDTVTTLTGGGIAHDSADSGNPHKFGGRAQDIIGAEPEEVADNDRVDALFDQNGRIGVTAGSDYKYADINDATSGNNTIVVAQAAGKRIAVWSIMVVSDGTVDVRWEDGAGGTAFTGQVPLQAREGYTYSAGGLVPLFVGSAATLLNLELTAAVNVHGHVAYTVLED